MYKLILSCFLILIPLSSFGHDVYKLLESSNKLQEINWENPETSFFSKMGNDGNISLDEIGEVLKRETDILFSNINFDSATLRKLYDTKHYRFNMLISSANKETCEQSKEALERLYGKNFISNDRSQVNVLDLTRQWEVGNTLVIHRCGGFIRGDIENIHISLTYAPSKEIKKEISIPILSCQLKSNERDTSFTVFLKIDETRNKILEGRTNNEIANILSINDQHIKFKTSNINGKTTTDNTFNINRYTGEITLNAESVYDDRQKFNFNYNGNCTKITSLEKKF